MEEKTIYVASDGKSFEDSIDCVFHEEELAFEPIKVIAEDSIVFYDEDKNEINTVGVDWVEFESAYVEAKYLVILETISEEILRVFYDELSMYCIPKEVGAYYWEDEEDKWIPYNKKDGE